jgi:ADP-heptose:LPS heptosyltransferase
MGYSLGVPPRILIVKLAALGDVALAARAVNSFAERYSPELELHWVIDDALAPLAQALLKRGAAGHCQGLDLRWQTLSATRLFTGNPVAKALEATRLAAITASTRPNAVALLHRDWRYRALLRPLFLGRLAMVTRDPIHELSAYEAALEAIASALSLKPRPLPTSSARETAPSRKLGVLVGGAANQKVVFREKRWPRLGEFVALALARTDLSVVLYGGPADREAADELLAKTPAQAKSRVTDQVGRIALADLPGELAGLDTFVSIDSGLAHVASSVMTAAHQRVVTLFGPTDPAIWAPRSSGVASCSAVTRHAECSPCYRNDGHFTPCPFKNERFQHCMTEISPEEVLSLALSAPTARR